MINLLKIFFIILLLMSCRRNNTYFLSELINYKGRYFGDGVISNGFYVNAVVSLNINDNGDVAIDITLNSENIYFFTDSNYMTKLSDSKYKIQRGDYYILLDFSKGLYFIYREIGKEISGNLTKQ
ncbi:hypothetical protein [Brachyspira sp. SAP_772]|uniref:hypothetical protein n=1 Tax=Brachyspira sp. SAP_772 TaxID=2608385 RepID=UPI0012F4E2B8|nr:hypothetical protein [Brachyspira sp. SAP_772]